MRHPAAIALAITISWLGAQVAMADGADCTRACGETATSCSQAGFDTAEACMKAGRKDCASGPMSKLAACLREKLGACALARNAAYDRCSVEVRACHDACLGGAAPKTGYWCTMFAETDGGIVRKDGYCLDDTLDACVNRFKPDAALSGTVTFGCTPN
jgi:hypothetical protein